MWSHTSLSQPISSADTQSVYNMVRALPFTNTGGTPNVDAALEAAYTQFDVVGHSDALNRDKKIVLVSNSYLTDAQQQTLCAKHETKIRTGSDGHQIRGQTGVGGFDVIMVNMGHPQSSFSDS